MSEHSPAADVTAIVPAALAALDDAGIAYCLRNGELRPSLPGEDVDVLVAGTNAARAVRVLAPIGWHRLRAPGHWGHRFVVRRGASGEWIKLDLVSQRRYGNRTEPVDGVIGRRRQLDGVWIAADADEEHHRQQRAAGLREIATRRERLIRKLPLHPRRRGIVVAVLGPDGAGKGTTIDAVRAALPVATSVVYLGDRKASSRDAARPASGSAGAPSPPTAPRRLQWLRESVFLLRKWLLLQPTVAAAYWRAWGGHVVLCDRHPLDAIAVAPARTAWGGRVERLLALRLTPSPDALIVLDAPGEVLFARKHEHSVPVLEKWRNGYRELPGALVIDTTAGVDASRASALDILWRLLSQRRGWSRA